MMLNAAREMSTSFSGCSYLALQLQPKCPDWKKKTFDYWKKNKVHPYSPHWKKNLRHWKKIKNLYFEHFVQLKFPICTYLQGLGT